MRLALGTVQFGLDYGVANKAGQVAPDEVRRILAMAQQMGMSTLDTAINYGQSEQVLGQCGVDAWKVVTKLPALPVEQINVEAWVQTHLQQSMTRLGVQTFHAVLLHKPQDLMAPQGEQLLKALHQVKLQGQSLKTGISVYSPEELDTYYALHHFDVVQAPFSILDQRLKNSGWLGRLNDMGVEVHSRSAFLQGLLLMNAQERPEKFAPWTKVWHHWDAWLDTHGLTPLQACIRYPLSLPEIDHVLIGVDSALHLQQIADAATGAFPKSPDWPMPLDLELLLPSRWN